MDTCCEQVAMLGSRAKSSGQFVLSLVDLFIVKAQVGEWKDRVGLRWC